VGYFYTGNFQQQFKITPIHQIKTRRDGTPRNIYGKQRPNALGIPSLADPWAPRTQIPQNWMFVCPDTILNLPTVKK